MVFADVGFIEQHQRLLLFSESVKWFTLRLLVNKTNNDIRKVKDSLDFLIWYVYADFRNRPAQESHAACLRFIPAPD
jgi:hypothetical protein